MADQVQPNPFTPSFGRIPPILAGRGRLLGEMERAFNSSGSDPSLSTILIGSRGTGKTTLLSYLARECGRYGWVSVNVTAMPGMLEDIFERALDAANEFVERGNGPRVKAMSVGQLFGVEWEYRDPASGNWRTRMTRLIEQLAEHGIGLLIAVDEVVTGFDELKQLASVYQHFISEGRKVSLLMAGLPANVSALLEDRSVSFLLRSSQRTLGKLADGEVSAAFKRTVELGGKMIGDGALLLAVEAIGGFPYLMQLVGFHAWNMSSECREISERDVAEGAAIARDEFFSGVLKRTYFSLSRQDRAFLKAMADIGGVCSLAEIAKLMDRSVNYARTYKKRLSEQGIITEVSTSEVEFALPLMQEFLNEQ